MTIQFGVYRFWVCVKTVAVLQCDPWWITHRNIGGIK